MPTEIERHRLPLKARLLSETEFKPLLAAAREAQGKYELELLRHDEVLNSAQHKQNLRHRLGYAASAEEINRLRSKIIELGTEPQAAEQAASRIIWPLFVAFKQAVSACHVKAAELAEGYATEARDAEAEMFQRFGMTHNSTALSVRAAQFKAELAQTREELDRVTSITSGSFSHATTFFTPKNTQGIF